MFTQQCTLTILIIYNVFFHNLLLYHEAELVHVNMHLVFLSIVLLFICIVLYIFQNKILFKLRKRQSAPKQMLMRTIILNSEHIFQAQYGILVRDK